MSKKKYLLLLIVILISSVFIYGCETKDFVPEQVPLEGSIREIIRSKGENYDFLSDELFIQKVNELGLSNDFTVGNLDDDRIPELVVYVERKPEDMEDQGQLQVYKFNGEKYALLDSLDMNYDNANYLLTVGKISENQNGIYLSNEVGAHSTVNYGFILENGKLKSILNQKKINLVSTHTNNEIKDVNQDGILEFSIYTNDPESEDQSTPGSDKIILWYKWDGKDSGELVQVDRFAQDRGLSRVATARAEERSLGLEEILPNLLEKSQEENKFDFTDHLEEYVQLLGDNLDSKSKALDSLFIKYQKGNNSDYLSQQYGLSLERLNDVEYLKREKILQVETELKDHLIKNLSMGYRLESSEGSYYYLINYQKLIDLFSNNITSEYRDFLKIMARQSTTPYLLDGSLMIQRDRLGERIIEIENFRINYPYSIYVNQVSSMYKNYVSIFLYGSPNSQNYGIDNKYSEGSIAVFKDTANKYPESYFSEILIKFISDLSVNLNILNEDIRTKTENMM